MKLLHLVWSNLKRKKLRALLTMLSIAVAFVLYGFLCAIKHAMVGGISLEGANRLVVRHKVSIIQLLPESYRARLLAMPGVEGVAHLTWFGGIYQEGKYFFAQMPVVPDDFLPLHPEVLISRESVEKWKQTRTGAIVGRKTAERLGWKVGDRVPLRSPIWGGAGENPVWEFEVVGIYDGREANTDTTGMFFRYDYFDEARNGGKGQVGWYIIRVADPGRAPEVAKAVDLDFANSPAETKTETEGAFVQAFAGQIGNIALITLMILSAVFFTILLVAGNTMSQAVRERLGELGVLKAIGFTNIQILGLILAESCLIAFLGGSIGLALACMLTRGGDPTGGMLPLFFFPPSEIALGFGIALVLGVLTGVFPAWQAMQLRVADALRRM